LPNIFLRLIAVLGLLALVICGIGLMLPRDYSIESEVDINAPSAEVFAMINSLPNWQQWSPWNTDVIPDLEIKYSGQKEGVGSVQHWKEGRGQGVLTITSSDPETGIEYKMQFANFPEMHGAIGIQKIASGTHVRWSSEGELPNRPFYGYFRFLFDRQMTYQYETGLSKLKSTLETGQ
jgi:hypothetical protein